VRGFDVQDKRPLRNRLWMRGIENNDTVHAWWSSGLFKLYKICRCFSSALSEMYKIQEVIASAEVPSQTTWQGVVSLLVCVI